MNTENTKRQAALDAGYSESVANKPAKIENSDGYKLAMAGIFAKTGNVSMAMLHEMQAKIDAGELKKQDMKTLVGFFDVMTRAMERIIPKEKEFDSSIIGAFGDIIDITPLETKDETQETIDNKEEILQDNTA